MLVEIGPCRQSVVLALSLSLCGLVVAEPAAADDVLTGIDLLTTGPGEASTPLNLPAGFFDFGSEPFIDTVALDGRALDQITGDPIGATDTIVERLADASGLTCGNPAVIPIELVALRLHGEIEVNYTSGAREIWDIEVCRSSSSPSTGTMSIEHTCGEGGTFSSTLTVIPRLIFTRSSDGVQRFLDPADSVTLTAAGSWVHDAQGQAATVGPGIQVDGDCDSVADAALPGTTNFFPGFAAGACDTCSQVGQGVPPPAQSPTPPLTKDPVGHFADNHVHTVAPPPPPPPPPPCSVDDDFENGAAGWSNDPASTCTTGAFVLGTPTEVLSTVVTQPGGDHTSGAGSAIFTATNTSAGVDDVDGGVCILSSPTWNVPDRSTLSVWYFHGQRDAGDDAGGDFFSLEVSVNGGAFTPFVSIGDVTNVASWSNATTSVPAGSTVALRLRVSDGAGAGDLIEGGIDDLSICPR